MTGVRAGHDDMRFAKFVENILKIQLLYLTSVKIHYLDLLDSFS